jgi:protein SCO1/2
MRTFFLLAFLAASFAAAIGFGAVMALADDVADPHAHHRQTMPGTQRSTVDYVLPPVKLVRDDGKTVSLAEELNDGRPVVLNFVYTSCTGICPVMSQTFSQLQSKLGRERERVHMVSISIDPEQDTPARLRAYAKKFEAGSQWQHYTGSTAASLAVQRAFDVYRGDKMNHTAVTLLRVAPEKPWRRIDGFTSGEDLLHEYRDLVAAQ